MPIRPEMRGRYPAEWPQVRAAILERAHGRCEWCGVPQYAVGYRDDDGELAPSGGNVIWDAARRGRHPNGERLTYAEARALADQANCCIAVQRTLGGGRRARAVRGCDDDGRHWIVVVLTIAHVHDDRPENIDPDNLAALCQRCHNRHDCHSRAAGIRERRNADQLTLTIATPCEEKSAR